MRAQEAARGVAGRSAAQARAERLPPVTLVRAGTPLLRAREADTFASRLLGLLALPPLEGDEALVIRPCSSVHTFGMDRPIDVAFVDRTCTVLRVTTLEPRRGAFCRGAYAAVEMAAGTARRLDIAPGQRLVPRDGGRP